MKRSFFRMLALLPLIASVTGQPAQPPARTFKEDVEFLQKYYEVVILSDASGKSQVAVVPALQGRVMTSTLAGPDGASYGWINREFIESRQNNPHINAFGGEDRFWMGPEGGQFSIFFKPGDPFDLDHWFTPPPLNEGPYDVPWQKKDSLTLVKSMTLENYSQTRFQLNLSRFIRILSPELVRMLLQVGPDPSLEMVAFASENKIVNTGESAWTRETGLLSVWILGMFNPSPHTTVVVPFTSDAKSDLGPIVNDEYFGKVPKNRLVIGKNALFFKADGEYRSKIGVAQKRAKPFMGSYDAQNKVLTIVQYSLPYYPQPFVNSMWKIHEDPYSGDAINSYNDGPAKPGEKPMGPFYELETSSPAAALRPQAMLIHTHRTYHFKGSARALNQIARTTLGVSLLQITSAFEAKAPAGRPTTKPAPSRKGPAPVPPAKKK